MSKTEKNKYAFNQLVIDAAKMSRMPYGEAEELLDCAFGLLKNKAAECSKIELGPLGVMKVTHRSDGLPSIGKITLEVLGQDHKIDEETDS